MARPPPPRPIRACLFDMDGLLLDTENLITVSINNILRAYNRPSMTGDIRARIQGLHLREASKILLEWSQLPLTFEEYQTQLAEQHANLFPTAQPLPGAPELLHNLSRSEHVEIALATSSGRGKFDLKTSHLPGLFYVFQPDCQILGDDPRLGPGRGKPEPDIYLLALSSINKKRLEQGQSAIAPSECLVFEDSIAGVESGRGAGMQVVWCPHPDIAREYRGWEEQVLAGKVRTEELNHGVDRPDMSGSEENSRTPRVLWSDDRWGCLLNTLEDFSYLEYGILL
jgi:pseudouridine-5'-monophosphatase